MILIPVALILVMVLGATLFSDKNVSTGRLATIGIVLAALALTVFGHDQVLDLAVWLFVD